MDKKTLIVLPSWGRDRNAYKKLIALAPDDYIVYVLSYEFLCPNGNIDRIEERIVDFIRLKKLPSVEIVGHSLGGTVGLGFAIRYPEYVSRLILVDAKVFKTRSRGISVFPTQWENLFIADNFGVAYDLVFRTGLRILFNLRLHGKLGLWALKFDATDGAAQIKVSTVILWGENDRSTPVKDGYLLHNLVPHSTLTVVPSVGHEWILHYPHYFWEAIVDRA
jgi:pimeloyl-ACP methyl ester carboxylesterase